MIHYLSTHVVLLPQQSLVGRFHIESELNFYYVESHQFGPLPRN